jgi:uncharacterized phiE125 gp8 family phage protein
MAELVPITAADSEPLSIQEAKVHLNLPVAQNYHDVKLAGLIRTATLEVENRTGWKLMDQTIELVLDGFPNSEEIRLEAGGITAITSVKYDDINGTEQTWASTNYFTALQGTRPRLVKKPTVGWPTTQNGKPQSVRIRMQAGVADRKTLPEHFITAIKLLIAYWYENPTAVNIGNIVNELPLGVEAILDNPLYKIWRL